MLYEMYRTIVINLFHQRRVIILNNKKSSPFLILLWNNGQRFVQSSTNLTSAMNLIKILCVNIILT